MENSLTGPTPDTIAMILVSKLTALKQPGKLNLGDVKVGDAGEAQRYFWIMSVPPGYGKKKKQLFLLQKFGMAGVGRDVLLPD